MAKAFSVPQIGKGARLTVRLPYEMQKDIKLAMKETGYGLKEQSRWISEAIDRLCVIPYFPELVAEDYIGRGRNSVVRVTLPAATTEALVLAIERAATEENLKDVQSKFIRTAIIQRLIIGEGRAASNS